MTLPKISIQPTDNMGVAISLIVPDENQTKKTLQDYYKLVHERQRSLYPGEDWPPVEERGGYQAGRITLNESGQLVILESIATEVIEALDTNRFYGLFESDSGKRSRSPIYGNEIRELISLFENAESNLESESNLMFDPEVEVRSKYIPLCEFALKNEYGIMISN